MPRCTSTPGVSLGTRIMDCWRCRSPPSAVLPMTMRISHPGFIAPDDHHFRPLITYSPPSRSILVAMLDASEEATSGSVMQNADLISPSSKGRSQRSRCCSVPTSARGPGFRRGAVQRLRRQPWTAPGDFCQRRVLEVRESCSGFVVGQKEVPQATAARLLLELSYHRRAAPGVAFPRVARDLLGEHRLGRGDILVHSVEERLRSGEH